MNYYPFHVGDYASATRHLSWDEDAAYRRLLDVYYTTEKHLPSDLRAVCRLVLATTDSQREAVRVVLDEFFQLTENGWKNGRADLEIEAMREKQESSEAKASHERDRMRRHRDRRSEMFAALRDQGVIPEWDISMRDLQRLHDTTCNAPATRTCEQQDAPETHMQREQPRNESHMKREQAVSCNAPETAIPTPTPTPTPISNTPPTPQGGRDVGKPKFNPVDCPAGINRDAWAEWVACRRSRRKPISEVAARQQWQVLAVMSPDAQAACIAESIRNDWTGLFPAKPSANVVRHPASAGSTRTTTLIEDLTDRSWAQ